MLCTIRQQVTSLLTKCVRSRLRSSQIGDLKKSDLPGVEALHTPGKKEGDIKLVKTDGGSVEAYQVRSRPKMSSPSGSFRFEPG
ncbi:MAG: hypothetical protein LBE44_00630 [Microbacterium hominis]|nr:hypothetical protein [Microbacterium hominis]